MKARFWLGWTLATVLFLTIGATWLAPAIQAHSRRSRELEELAHRYAPVLYFHADEIFRPQAVDVLLQSARVRRANGTLPDSDVAARVELSALPQFQDPDYYLDLWLGDESSSDNLNYSALRQHYEEHLSPSAGGPPIVTYARVVTGENPNRVTIQYWFFYLYNDWFNKHEGDWEMVQVMLNGDLEPEWAVYSQHEGGTRRRWQDVHIEEGTHPVVYIALGSHANYFWGPEQYPHGRIVGNSQVEVLDRTGRDGRIMPAVVLLPAQASAATSSEGGPPWLAFAGRWGEDSGVPEFSGPFGPAFKGEQWDQPYTWGMAQPTDLEQWYAHRLRVEVRGAQSKVALVTNWTAHEEMVEILPNLALLHDDLQPHETITAIIDVVASGRSVVAAFVPSPQTEQVIRYRFDDVALDAEDSVALALRVAETPVLFVEGGQARWPDRSDSESVLWDAPDFVWMARTISTSDLLRGLAISFLAGVVPAYFFLVVLYYLDRYEKEPVRLIATAFFWGAWPAFAIAVAAIILVRLPIEIWGRDAVEVVQAGFLGPVVEEVLKGAVVIYIVYRFRDHIDAVHDGIIFGAAVGLGYAMTANMLGYMGAFLTRGFVEMQNKIFIDGFLHGLNQAFYSALVGAGLAYAILSNDPVRRLLVPPAMFLLAVAGNAAHDLILRQTNGVSAVTIGLTWAQFFIVFAIMLWSLRQQHRCIQEQLQGEVPDSLCRTVLNPAGRAQAQSKALKQGGLRSWRDTRRVYHLCARLALRKAKSDAHPEQPELAMEVERTRAQLHALMTEGTAQIT